MNQILTPILFFILPLHAGNAAGISPELPLLEVKAVDEDPSGCPTYQGTLHLRNGKKKSLSQYCVSLELSPDQRYVAIRAHNKEYGLFLVNTQDGVIKRHVQLQKEGDPEIGRFIWSSDSRYLAFTVCNQEMYPKRAKLFIRDVLKNEHRSVDVGSIHSVGAGCYVFDPAWSPDSSKLAIVENSNYEKYWVSIFAPSGKKVSSADLSSNVRDDHSKPFEEAAVYNNVERLVWEGDNLWATLSNGTRVQLKPR